MSTTGKITAWVVVAIVVAGGIWWWFSMSQNAVSPTAVNLPSQPANQAPAQQNPAGVNPAPAAANGVSAIDNSNAALQTDLSNIDSQMNGFSSDNASISQGLNDQPVQQSSL